MNLKEFVSIISELLQYTSFDVEVDLNWGIGDYGKAYSITDNGKLLDAEGEVIFDFSDWDDEDDGPGVISNIEEHFIEICYNYELIKLVMPQPASYNLIKHFLKRGHLVKQQLKTQVR